MDDAGAAPPVTPPTAQVRHRGRHRGEDAKGRQVTIPAHVAERLEIERDRVDGSARPMGIDRFTTAAIVAGLRVIRDTVPDWEDPLAAIADDDR